MDLALGTGVSNGSGWWIRFQKNRFTVFDLGQDLLKECWDELENIPWVQIHGYQSSNLFKTGWESF